jgi:GH15 family glucan-1,4-alpha-glucosidase
MRNGGSLARRPAIAVSAALVLALAVAVAALASAGSDAPAAQPRLKVAAVAQDPCHPLRGLPVPAQLSGQFGTDSSIMRAAGEVYAAPGRLVPLTRSEAACVAAAERADRDWLRAGLVPGATATQRSMAIRALLDLRLAVQPDGAVLAGWYSGWEYAWPRDSCWVADALAGTGHPAMAYRILRFLQRVQEADGTWAARYWPDGAGPVRDGRPAELDADGWVPWAVWSWALTQRLTPGSPARRELALLWPMLVRAADAATRSLTSDGLPRPALDYWEDTVQVTIGTAAPLLAGLRAAADLAADIGGATAAGDGRRWAATATQLARAITATFGRTGYQRTPAAGSGADAAVTFLGPPFAGPDPGVLRAVNSAQRALAFAGGGLRPGTRWPGIPGVAWTAETGVFALFDAATGQRSQAAALLAWLAGHRTRLGSVPEQVSSALQPASVAPLSWTDAAILLTMLAQAGHLPTLPVPAL